MFGLFKNKMQQPPLWQDEVQETQSRWFVFLERLESKIVELCEAAIPTLQKLYAVDTDMYKRNYQQLLSGINGQLENIRQKANEAYENNIRNLYDDIICEVSATSPHFAILQKFRKECTDRFNIQFEETCHQWHTALYNTSREDLEGKYQTILNEYETIKNKFNCQQCGGNIEIDKIFFITAYVACSHCQTNNTFEPSTQARNLQNFAKNLAEQRTAHLLEAYTAESAKERELYHKIHDVHLGSIHEKNKKILAQKKQLEEELERERQAVIRNAPPLYEKYLRAMFDELNKIIPDFTEHNEKVYRMQLKQFRTQY